jgi:plastocyanin
MEHTSARKIFVGALGIVILLVIVLGIVSRRERSASTNLVPASSPVPQIPISTREALPAALEVPERDSKVPENVAKPAIVVPSAPTAESQLRVFEIKINEDRFLPDTVIVRKGDIVRVKFTAVDKGYDVYQPDYGFRQEIPKGESKPVGFGAHAVGRFTFFCKTCGGPAEGPVGYLMVVE